MRDPYRANPILDYGRYFRYFWWFSGLAVLLCLITVLCLGITKQMFLIHPDWSFHRADGPLDFAEIADPGMSSVGKGSMWTIWTGPTRDANRLALWSIILRSVPAIFAGSVFLMSADFSHYHLYAQPLANMYTGPSPARDTILLDYMTKSSKAALLQAWNLGHWKVLYFGILALTGSAALLLPVGMLSLTIKDGVIYGRFSPGFVVSTALILGVYLISYAVGYFSTKRRFPHWETSLIDIWALCFFSHLAQYPEFSECGPGWTKSDLEASLQLRNDQYLLGLCTGTDGVQRIGFDVATIGRQQMSSGLDTVLYVSPERKTTSHCHLCADNERYHLRPDVKERNQLLRRQYQDWCEPIGLSRGFDATNHQDHSIA